MWLATALAIVLGLWVLHCLALWLERRGWLYYRHRRSRTSALGAVFSELHSIADPGHRHAIEELEREVHEQDDAGAPPDPWTPGRAP